MSERRWSDEPIEPPPTRCAFPSADEADETGIVGIGGDLEPGTLLTAYRNGLFPMPLGRHGQLAWWSPDPRAIIPLSELHISRSLRRSRRRFAIRIDTCFETVIDACADPSRPDGWITGEIRDAYVRLHELGWAHSIETWDPVGDRLVGGLYGIAVGGLFAGESMFHWVTDASKVALMGLVELLSEPPEGMTTPPKGRLLDVQWATPHLQRLGACEVRRRQYVEMVHGAVRLPLPRAFLGRGSAAPPSQVGSRAGAERR